MLPEQSGRVELTESRVDRKRREARERLIREAERLMRSKPVDEVTISEITEAADVGHGSFYLHFKSKNEVLVPIIQKEGMRWDELIQARVKGMDDPAEVLAFSARQMGRVIAGDELWRWFLKHSGVPAEDMRNAIGAYSARDMGRGLLSGRFNVPEVSIGSAFMIGGFVQGMLAAFESNESGKAIDQIVEMLLRTLGVLPDEARQLAHKALPEIVPQGLASAPGPSRDM